ncbi:WD40 repeat-like protein [Viridothelium virens]|uniref:Glutamate-rich WD repeat-containing protein 1 n=1 Tax=Viridothelium virens TaxID=1048519 RepID=A0A6A6HLC5_VIRVR|nr:WD40 repeat-like protein [Viridothelium virens]
MSKRTADDPELQSALKSGARPQKALVDGEEMEFEDEFEDEFDSDEEIMEAGVDGRPDEEREAEEREGAMDVDQDTFMIGRNKLNNGEILAPDLSTYEMLHNLEPTWPCLSLDIIKDNLGDERKSYPATVYAVAGTQAARGRERENQLLVMKLSGLSRMDRGQEDDSDDDDTDDEENADPILETKTIPTGSCTNRVRAHQVPAASGTNSTTLTAAMTESGQVLIHNISSELASFDTPGMATSSQHAQPLGTVRAHAKTEGYAVDWSPVIAEGKLLTGDVNGRIFTTTIGEGGQVTTDKEPFTGHKGTVEELQWSPVERSVFASAGNDGTVRIWDLRSKSRKSMLNVPISSTDVNVLSWSHQNAHLLASGADDGQWAVWDLRQWKPNSSKGSLDPTPVASFDFHKEQITSIEWHPTDDSIVAVAAGDNTLSLWDLAVELDDDESRNTAGVRDVPPQLLFVHYMDQVKEAHWHPQIPGCIMATGGSGFGVFKTISV